MSTTRMMDYTIVVGVDAKHLRQLSWTWPTWKRHKPSLLEVPLVAIYDREQTTEYEVMEIVDHPSLKVLPWPPDHVIYHGDANSRWRNPQRYKMLSAFVHCPPLIVETSYWLKLDTDVVATGHDDWIDPVWFDSWPAIIAQKWGYTKPSDQMDKLDDWAYTNWPSLFELADSSALLLHPQAGATALGHKRIISWCGVFNTEFTRQASAMAERTCGEGKLPVPSQDGYLWYLAARLKLPIVRANMKSRGWRWQSGDANVRRAAEEAMADGISNPAP